MHNEDKIAQFLTPFASLSPDAVIQAVESQGYLSDGRILALNSYENRVYQVGIEDDFPLIAKFYRPDRWTDAQIQEEHDFCYELLDAELPVICPMKNAKGETLRHSNKHRIALFERKGGRAPDMGQTEHLKALAQQLGRMHAVSKQRTFKHRPTFSVERFGIESKEAIEQTVLPAHYLDAYQAISAQVLNKVQSIFDQSDNLTLIRTHGDCHMGNVLLRDEQPFFVDFDDTLMAPATWDLWMLLSGDRQEQSAQFKIILDEYELFNDWNYQELKLIESFRTLRLFYFTAWLARRWQDPAFQQHFPWFNTERFWSEHIQTLKEQLFQLDEPPLSILL
ncbi:MAG: serine/threonine protein kinase [Cellvibrionales bacterium]|nr:serine/threonine protein kinase [Cellvibrionales bacterium]